MAPPLPRRRILRFALAGLAVVLLAAVAWAALDREGAWDFARGYAAAPAALTDPPGDQVARGARLFAYGDFGALNTDAMQSVAVPWKVASTALLMADAGPGRPVSAERLPVLLQRYGFLHPSRLPGLDQAASGATLGLIRGTASRSVPPMAVEIANTGCAACHAAVGYDAQGLPKTAEAWLGSPNTSIHLQAYSEDVYAALRTAMQDEAALAAAIRQAWPRTSAREMSTLRAFIFPLARQRIATLEKAGAGPLPFANGPPGITNGVAALKLQTKGLDAPQLEHGHTAIPELADRVWRSALLYDGAYAPPEGPRFRAMTAQDLSIAHRDQLGTITTFFTVPTMGQSPERARAAIPDGQAVMAFLATRRPQPFPGPIDAAAAGRGRATYDRACAGCHGTYDQAGPPRLTGFPNWCGEVGTDRQRMEAMTPDLVRRIEGSAYRGLLQAAHTGCYAAPPLTGLWSSAPYLHNGSVPSLAQLVGLEPRATRFAVGGHALDLERVGISYPAGYRPWSKPGTIDTTKPGFGNGGHEREFAGLTPGEKRDLIAFLKRL
jgi:mono/diheme cytochrome c family protein